MFFGTMTIDHFKKIWPKIYVAKGEVVNQDFDKDNIGYIEPGQDIYVPRCRAHSENIKRLYLKTKFLDLS